LPLAVRHPCTEALRIRAAGTLTDVGEPLRLARVSMRRLPVWLEASSSSALGEAFLALESREHH